MARANDEWLTSERTRRALARLDGVLHEAASANDLQLRTMAFLLIEQGGKRLRPALVLLAAEFGKFDLPPLLRAAAAMELMHVASLYHDDVIDRAPLRRRGVSANARWGNEMATLTGTFLFARASVILASIGDIANQIASQASVALCTGQLLEVENAYNVDLSEIEYLEILERKTATLFELPCRLGALLSRAPSKAVDALSVYGRNLGIAFQLVDDALDLTGQAGALGKATGTDLREGIYSLPVRRALLRPASDRLRALLRQVSLSETDIEEVISLLQECRATEETLETALSYARLAQDALGDLPDNSARRSLYQLADFVVTRSM